MHSIYNFVIWAHLRNAEDALVVQFLDIGTSLQFQRCACYQIYEYWRIFVIMKVRAVSERRVGYTAHLCHCKDAPYSRNDLGDNPILTSTQFEKHLTSFKYCHHTTKSRRPPLEHSYRLATLLSAER